MAKLYHTRPSSLLDMEDPYTAFCLDEACAYITGRMERGDQPQFRKHYHSFRDLYAAIE